MVCCMSASPPYSFSLPPYCNTFVTSAERFETSALELALAKNPKGFFLPYSPECVEGVFSEVRLLGILRSSLPASNAQATAKIAHLSDTPAPIREYGTHVTTNSRWGGAKGSLP